MKKLSLGVLCALGMLGSGCDFDIPNEQMGMLTAADLCAYSGGDFNEREKNCYCDGHRCGENVTCGIDADTNKYVCLSAGNMDYPQYTCTLPGMTLCFDRIINTTVDGKPATKTAGYSISCEGTSWSTPSPCENGYSCSGYLEHDVFYASKCGECNNQDTGCIRGTKKDEAH